MRGKRLPSLWPMAVLLAVMIAVVGVATVRRAGGAGNAQAGEARPSITLQTHPGDRTRAGR